jgi:hypothetical protein
MGRCCDSNGSFRAAEISARRCRRRRAGVLRD